MHNNSKLNITSPISNKSLYQNKYLKYKKKYLDLKNSYKLLGGEPKNIYLPCEIHKIAKGIFVNINFKPSIERFILPTIAINTNVTEQFAQDPAILLKNKDTEQDCAIIIKKGLDLSYIPEPQKFRIPFTSGNDYGGNFISSPSTDIQPFGCVFCFHIPNEELLKVLNQNLCQNIIQLNCSFRYNGERHIDEAMCFMPYGAHWKVWFYYIRTVKHSPILEKTYTEAIDTQKIIIEKLMKLSIERKLCDLIIAKLNGLDVDEKEYAELSATGLRKIQNRLSGDEKTILNMFLDESSMVNKVKDLEKIKKTLDEEQIYNLNHVSIALYGTDYMSNRDKFVLFPLDIEITETFQFKISNIPFFNRLWYENDTDCCLLLSTGDVVDREADDIFMRELPFIKSCNNPEKILHHSYINTSIYNSMGDVGGNLHCLVKMIY